MTAMQRDRRRLLCAGLLLAAGAPWARAAVGNGDRKAALVIGNADYRVGALKNPVNDAQAVADSLRGLGFDVVLRRTRRCAR